MGRIISQTFVLHVTSNIVVIACVFLLQGVVFPCKKCLACGVPFLVMLVLHFWHDRELTLFLGFYTMIAPSGCSCLVDRRASSGYKN